MANAVKGEVGFQVGDDPYVLVYDFNALCALEDAFDVDASRIGEVIGGRASGVRTVFRLGLARHHPGMTDEEAGDIISAIGPPEAGRLITEAFKRAFPEAAKGKARPPAAARAGTS